MIFSATREGLAADRARSRVGGRPTVVTPQIIRAAHDVLPNLSPASPPSPNWPHPTNGAVWRTAARCPSRLSVLR